MSKVEITLDSTSNDLTELFDCLATCPALLAGGAARSELTGEPVSDYDVFFPPPFDLTVASDLLILAGWRVVFKCPMGELISMEKDKLKAQLICKTEYQTPDGLIAKFDFTACMFAVTKEGVLHTTSKALRNVFKKELVLNELTYPVATLRRVTKYENRGYRTTELFWRNVFDVIREKDQWPDESLRRYPID